MDVEKVLGQLTLEEKARMCAGHDFWHTEPVERLGVSTVMMCDGPHGLRKQVGEGDHMGINESIKAVCFPTASALASSFDREVMGRLGGALGDECQAENVGMLLGPGLNIKRSPLCGRNFEYFSEDPTLAGEMGVAYVSALQGKGIAACPKHFAVNSQETRRMSSDSRLDERTLHEIYLPAFEAVVKRAKARSIMCSYNKINGTFASENKELLTNILREKWGFEGFVVTDWGAVKDRVTGLQAGLDLEMPGGPSAKTQDIITAVEDGTLEVTVLDNAVRDILAFVSDYQAARKSDTVFDLADHHALSGEISKECAVLLKNEGEILPLRKSAKVAFIGEFADTPRYQGAGSSFINVPHAVSAVEASSGLSITYAKGYNAKDEESDLALQDEAVKAAKMADAAVVFAGLTSAYEVEGVDRNTLAMPENQNKLIRSVLAAQKNTIVVLHGGAPIEMPWGADVPAILNMHLGGDNVGTATVALLFGDANPSGKLSESWPCKLSDTPSYFNFPGDKGVVEYQEGVFVGYRYYDKKQMQVSYPFGHGLSYTSFEYRDLELDKQEIDDTDVLTVHCKVRNTGGCAGKEAVQLYIRPLDNKVMRPVRELREFAKVALQPGEEKTISFTLDKHAFAYYETLIHDWHVESGRYAVEIGASSRDIRLEAEVQVGSTVELPITYTADSTLGDLMESAGGREMMAEVMPNTANDIKRKETSAKHLGGGSEKMMQAMMFEMPLSAMVSFGRLSKERLDEMLVALNRK